MTDTISSLSWSPTADLLCSTCWDGKSHVFEVVKTGANYNQAQANPKAECISENSHPVLCSAFDANGSVVYLGGADGTVRMWNLSQPLNGSPAPVLGRHERPVCAISFYARNSWVVTAGYDGKVNFWSSNSNGQPVGSIPLNAKAFAMDLRGDVLVVANSNQTITVINMGGAQPAIFQTYTSELKFQTRCISVLPDCSGFAVGGIEGRVSIFPFNEQTKNENGKNQSNRFAFRCHRQSDSSKKTHAFSINKIAFHPNQSFITAGGDGEITFWNYHKRSRLKRLIVNNYEQMMNNQPKYFKTMSNIPVTAANFNSQGSMLAYATGYDWSRGHAGKSPANSPNKIYIYVVQQYDVETNPNKR